MGLFQPNYAKPGKGVDESAPEKRSFFRFWELYFRKFGKTTKLSLIYAASIIPTFLIFLVLSGMITSMVLSLDSIRGNIQIMAEGMTKTLNLPVEKIQYDLLILLDGIGRVVLSSLFTVLWGMGPATAGATYIWRNFAREEHAWIWSDFKDAFRSNFKQSLIVFIVDLVVLVSSCLAIRVYSAMTGPMNYLQYFIMVLLWIYTMMHLYLYPMMVTFDLSLKDLYRNALIFAIGKLPSNLLVMIILVVVHVIPAYLIASFVGEYFIFFLIVYLALEALLLLGFSGFLVNFNASYKMRRYMMPEEEDSVSDAEDGK